MNMDNNIFPLGKYKGKTYKYILDQNDIRYYKYLIGDFRNYWTEIYSFYEYLRLNNKFVDEINILLNIKMVLDTETTGLSIEKDRVVEIACIELQNHFPTKKIFHSYINPDNTNELTYYCRFCGNTDNMVSLFLVLWSNKETNVLNSFNGFNLLFINFTNAIQ